jgi:hypothetical protein
MRVVAVHPYEGPVADDGLVDVYDLTVEDTHLYAVAGLLVSNSKRISMLDVNALLSHGAVETLGDAGSVRGQKNEDYWLQFMQGNTPRAAKVPAVHEKFVHQLKAAGINVVREGPQLHVMALTDADVRTLAGDRLIKSGDTVRFDRDLKPVPGGLFDPQLTGGHGGRRWAAIELAEPLPNPVMEEPIRRLLGLTRSSTRRCSPASTTCPSTAPARGRSRRPSPTSNVDREIETAKAQWRHGRGNARDQAVRRWGYLQAAKARGLHPRDWVLARAPVLPPAFRPVSVMGDKGLPLVSDANYLYKELIDANRN